MEVDILILLRKNLNCKSINLSVLVYLFKVWDKLSLKTFDSINWTEVVKKEAKGLNDADLGEVQEVRQEFVIKSGIVDKELYSIPKNLAERYDGHNLWFRVTKEEAENQYKIKD